MVLYLLFAIYFISISLTSQTSTATDILTPAQNFTDGETLVSSNKRFEFGFFTPGNSSNRFLGIWYHNLPLTVVWVANKGKPLTDSSGGLNLNRYGGLVLYNRSTSVVWSANLTVPVNRPVLQLLDSGNLVVRDEEETDSNNYVWESFDYLSDTLLPGMKLGWKLKANLNRFMRSWKSIEDPSDGEFTFSLDPPESPQLILRRGWDKQYRWGPWDGVKFSGSPELKTNAVFKPIFNSHSDEVYYKFEMVDESILSRFVVTPLGLITYFIWRNNSREWVMMVTLNRYYCDRYGMCGTYGSCYSDDPNCRCLKRFTPKSPQDWRLVDWSGGCKRRHALNCSNGDGFVKYTGLKLPDNSTVWPNYSGEECSVQCLKKCSCMAYTTIDVHGNGSECMVWLNDLVDIRESPNDGDEIYIRMAREELDSIADAKRKRQVAMIVVVVISTILGMLLSAVVGYYICRLKKAREKAQQESNSYKEYKEENQDDNLELPLFDEKLKWIESEVRNIFEKLKRIEIGNRNVFTVLVGSSNGGGEGIAVDTLAPNQTLTDNGVVLVSSGGRFELGFFSPSDSNNRYVGIWFGNVPQQTPVWVANKNNPLPDSSGVLTITATGNAVITNNRSNIILWSSSSSSTTASSPVLQLLNTGNLVVKTSDNSGNYLWQSFDYPCDTLLPGMKLGWNLRTGQEWYITSWKSLQDPSSGDYTYRVDSRGLPQLVLRQGSTVVYRSGPWDGVRFGGGPALAQNPVFTPIFVFNATYVYYSFQNNDQSTISRFVVNQSGSLDHLTWNQGRGEWVDIISLRADNCDNYAACGPNGVCNINVSPVCQCPNGFIPRLPQDWERLDWTGGCVLRTPLNCSAPEGFKRFSGLKLPDSSNFLVNGIGMSPEECRVACLRNCSCVTYAVTEISGCVVWFGDLVDIREYSEGGQDLYIRMAASELGSNSNAKRTAVIASVSAILGVIILGLISWLVIWKRSARQSGVQSSDNPNQENNQSNEDEELELPLFDLVTISKATNNFSFTNKIGEGGFGPVYRGKLSTGQEIAVKRLSKDSGQGLKELKNEVILIVKLQHRNLVRLLGCCIHGEERMLIYEYMPNKSLDLIIFS
ncbi:hypothetical protein F0562_014166 [Nyssa sinensis]|uniref:non-specific serine/threonine protein kinase n=1 Tax=Nyssa sinensis TaxID=561372 RepID=A0A5J4ZPZ0_9ASTE|nr:hypothetical protein F0562_014166 [Nyssa sinensis]